MYIYKDLTLLENVTYGSNPEKEIFDYPRILTHTYIHST